MSSPAIQRRRTLPRPMHAAASETGVPLGVPAPAAVPDAQPPATGRFRCDSRGEAWWWSPEMYLLHGLAPGSADPSTRLLLASQHPADQRRTAHALAVAWAGQPTAVEVRTARPGTRTVVLVLEPQRDPSGAVASVEGLCIDLPAGGRVPDGDHSHDLATEVAQLRTAMASRAAIEQAKGILMLLTSCSDQVAFDLLAHISSHTHRKVREVAVAITESASGHGVLPADIRAILHDACPPTGATRPAG
jgi:hypothetical protein